MGALLSLKDDCASAAKLAAKAWFSEKELVQLRDSMITMPIAASI